jgi:asparagine synthase (glutamine-hydrolysing)
LRDYIPEEIFNQPKKGFSVPIGKWMRKELKGEIITTLSDSFLNAVPNLDTSKFKVMLKEHIDEKNDNSFSIWKLYVLAKWYQEFGFYSNSAEPKDAQYK